MLTDIEYRIKHSKAPSNLECSDCNMLRQDDNEGCLVCTNCGETEYVLNNVTEQSGTDQDVRITYLKEIFKRFQSREPTYVPDTILTIIKTELFRSKIRADRCTTKDILTIMKKNHLHKYYPNIHQIYCAISGSQPLSISKETEEKIIQMFKKLVQTFDKLFPNSCKFLSYPFVLNKLFHILQIHDIADCFPLLKDQDNLREQNYRLYQIFKQLDWKYPSSVFINI